MTYKYVLSVYEGANLTEVARFQTKRQAEQCKRSLEAIDLGQEYVLTEG